ncbi:hypothetical protein A2572_02200 [Candidatus Collierbacteria bacterium RIFOXYD1_FULL_40_9]|uniref:SH3b domain-containing protein n=1 Tax=Candidatus Collierbacteria bacterium RIFOXYD1_FULL_40_9 TaxID=1817731 RepID=A0A1F5FTR8_9BACT|nr:MAG: hypothetical protein A2572_02200 [Candidatus Collierbacteria bacterium RIFOXYD1_FULL_40_9]
MSFAFLLSGCELNPFAKKAGVQVTASPDANVTIDGKPVGKTPYYIENAKPGMTTIQMTAIDSGQTWETKVNLISGTLTTVHREFGASPDKSHSYTLYFEKLSNKDTSSVNVISMPPSATVSIDGKPQGFTPLSVDIPAGPHVFSFTSPGFQDKIVNAATQNGYRLNLNLTMATMEIVPTPLPTASPSATPSITSTPSKAPTNTITPLPKQSSPSATLSKPFVEILDTPTGWLKVRESASINSAELAKVNPGDTFPYRESSPSGWFNIQYATGKWGFISSQYAKLVK